MLRVLFGTLKVRHVRFADEADLIMHGNHRPTCLVLSSGGGVSFVVPFVKGQKIVNGIRRVPFGGKDLTDYLERALAPEYPDMKGKFLIAKDIKEKTCVLPEAPDSQNMGCDQYTMPDGRTIQLGDAASRCVELLFDPSPLEKSVPGLHELVFESVQACDADVRKELYRNIILAGGNTLFRGFEARLKKELKALDPGVPCFKVIPSISKIFSVWVGGCVLSTSFGEVFKREHSLQCWEEKEQRRTLEVKQRAQAAFITGFMVREKDGGIGFRLPTFLLRLIWAFISPRTYFELQSERAELRREKIEYIERGGSSVGEGKLL
jgi:actin-related protein